jgi:hypothetical protein
MSDRIKIGLELMQEVNDSELAELLEGLKKINRFDLLIKGFVRVYPKTS